MGCTQRLISEHFARLFLGEDVVLRGFGETVVVSVSTGAHDSQLQVCV